MGHVDRHAHRPAKRPTSLLTAQFDNEQAHPQRDVVHRVRGRLGGLGHRLHGPGAARRGQVRRAGGGVGYVRVEVLHR